jgi:hypothetical protein
LHDEADRNDSHVLVLGARMPSQDKETVLHATRRWMRPVIHVLLLCGVTWNEFCALAKTLYVEVASAKFGKRGRPTNVSRTAMLTGLTRRDVRTVREHAASGDAPLVPYASKASQILSRWHLDPDFLDARGAPIALPLEGNEPSFLQLLRRSGAGDIPLTTVVRELLSVKAIRKRADGRFEALQRSYIPRVTDEQLIRLWGTVLADVANAYVHNITRTGRMPSRFERAAKSERIPLSMAPAFREFVEREGQAFLERVDTWLAEHEVNGATEDGKRTTRMGAGVYQIQD